MAKSTRTRKKTTAHKRTRAQTSGRLRAPRQQSEKRATRRTERDDQAAELRREIARKVAEGRKLRRDIETRIERLLRDRP